MKTSLINFYKTYKNKFMNLSIRNKMIIANCIIISFVAFAIGGTAYSIYRQTITSRLSMLNLKDMKQIGNSIDYLQKDITELASFIGSDKVVQKVITYEPEELNKICPT